MKKTLTAVFICIMILIIILSALFFKTSRDHQSIIDNLTYSPLNLNTIADGSYIGSADTNLIQVTVRVTIKDHLIQQIDILKHNNGKGEPAESIITSVLEKQSLDVDTISGATSSSKLILKAIENALKE